MKDGTSHDQVRALYPQPTDVATRKVLDRLDRHCQHFISLSPFLVIASSAETGADATPRGDAPGFVAVIDDRTLLIPDRRGNNRIDTLTNVTCNPAVGLLFMVPGVNETLRVNGTGAIVFDPAVLAPMSAQGKPPASALRVSVREAFFHCGKALIRSRLWQADSQIDRGEFPTLGRIISDQIAGIDAEAADENLQEAYRNRLY